MNQANSLTQIRQESSDFQLLNQITQSFIAALYPLVPYK